MKFNNPINRKQTRILLTVLLTIFIGLSVSSCSLRKLTNLNNYEDYAEVSNTIWASLYFMFNDITVPGYDELIYKDTVWSEKDSPIVISKNTYVLPGVTVTVKPGTTVQLGKDVLVTCRGIIDARGTPDKPITFTWHKEGEYWDSLECLNCIQKGEPGPGRVVFEHCIVEHGGGLVVNSSEARVDSCVFRHNIATPLKLEYGGGVITRNKVYANSNRRQEQTGNGGGINVYSDKKVRVEENEVYDNEAHGGRDGGGGIYAFAYNDGDVRVINNIVRDNVSDKKAGGIFAYDARIIGNRVIDNQAGWTGGGIYAIQAVLKENTVTGNTSPSGGGIYTRECQLNKNLIWKNRAQEGAGLYHDGDGSITGNTLVENECPEPLGCGTIVLSGNPEMRRNNIIAADGYALKYMSHSLSPDLRAVENYWGTAASEDIEYLICDWLENSDVGLVRYKPYLSRPAEGSCPFPADAPLMTEISCPDLVDGTIRGLIETDTELGGAGEKYVIEGNLLVREGRNLTIQPGTELFLRKGASLRVRGQLFAIGEKEAPIRFTGDDSVSWGHIIFENRSLDEADQERSEKSRMEHCLIENGSGVLMDGQGADMMYCDIRGNQGTGIRIKEVPVTIGHCRITDNVSQSDGGGLYVYGSKTVLVHDNEIMDNCAADGGGIFAYGYQSNAAVDIRRNLVTQNRSRGDGGGLWISRSAVVGNTIVDNQTDDKGGGIYASFALVHDNTVKENIADSGGGIYAEANSSLKQNTITANTGLGTGGGVYLNYWGLSMHNKTFANNIIENNDVSDPDGTGGVVVTGELKFLNNSIYGNTGFQLHNLTPAAEKDLAAPGCYWGTTAADKIEAMIFDGRDDAALSRVEYQPFAPSRQAALEKVVEEE